MITPDPHMGGTSRSSTDIESDIRRTRSRMDSTLDELGSQLTARSVLHTLLDLWESRRPETPRSAARTRRVYGALSEQVAHQVRENPIPSLLIGAGIAWAIYDRTADRGLHEEVELGNRRYRVNPSVPAGPKMPGAAVSEYEYEDLEYEEIEHEPGLMERAKSKLHEGKEAVSDAAAAARERISGAGESAKERAGEMRGAAHDAAERARLRARNIYSRGKERGVHMGERVHARYDAGSERFTEAVHEYPLGVGIGFAALGALIGLLLPHTRREDELLGEKADEIMDVVKEKGRETIDRTKSVAERVAETAMDEAKRQGLTPEAAREKLSSLAGKAGEVVKKAKEEATAEGQHFRPKTGEPLVPDMPAVESQPGQGQSVTMPPKSSSTSTGSP